MRLAAGFYVRGGIFTTVIAETRKRGWRPPPELDLTAAPSQPSTRYAHSLEKSNVAK